MNNIRMRLEGNPLRIVLPGGSTTIGSVADHAAATFTFEREARYASDSLRLYLASEHGGFQPVELGGANEFPLPDLFTQTPVLKMQAAFVRGGAVIANSNVVRFYLRDSLARGGAEIPPLHILSAIAEQAVTAVDTEEDLVRFQNIAGETVGSVLLPDFREDMEISARIADRTYTGRDLAALHAAEIAAAPFYGDPWAWLQARIRAADWRGIHVGDWLGFTTLPGDYTAADGVVAARAEGHALKARIAGIDAYYGYGDAAVPHHIDFTLLDGLWPDHHAFNKAAYMNGTVVSPVPWLASDAKAWMNSEAARVPVSDTANPRLMDVDYTATGVYDKLPAELRAVVIQKRMCISAKYSPDSIAMQDTGAVNADIGYCWVPSEAEVFGAVRASGQNHLNCRGDRAYPIFSLPIMAGGAYRMTTSTFIYGPEVIAVSNENIPAWTMADNPIGVPLCFRVA